ncbi:MAG: helix-turn-helix domain-containing protein [Luteitalea sp.]|nr:helix-turn-helix domain-containing protein [Luteitalea sp.]
MPVDKKPDKNVVPMLVKAFSLLEDFRQKPEGLSYVELVERHRGISKVSVYRILCSLEALGYLEKDDDSKRYQLGSKFIELGSLTEKRLDIIRLAEPYMRKIRDTWGENVNLAKIQAGELVYLRSLEGTYPIVVRELTSRNVAVYSSALGKAILADLAPLERDAFVSRIQFKKLTPNTITDKETFMRDLERSVRTGYAIDDEENTVGVRCVGSAILDGRDCPVAALSVTGPATRMTQMRAQEIGSQLAKICREISARRYKRALREGRRGATRARSAGRA